MVNKDIELEERANPPLLKYYFSYIFQDIYWKISNGRIFRQKDGVLPVFKFHYPSNNKNINVDSHSLKQHRPFIHLILLKAEF